MMDDQLVMEPLEAKYEHKPVMHDEVMEYLNPSTGAVFVDATLGLGGHAKSIINHLGETGRLIGIDLDSNSLEIAKNNLAAYLQQCDFIQDNYRNIDIILSQLEIDKVDGILLDLGISSYQLDDPQRGFSIRSEGPLDMRMDQEGNLSAYDLINSISERELALMMKDFGEERWHRAIARSLVFHRAKKPIETTKELADIVLRSIPFKRKWQKIHPATRTFQALRIAVNGELEALETALDKCVDLLKEGGRIGVIAFHSLEDRIVKHKFRFLAKDNKVNLIMKKPLFPSEEETRQNPRARSARLRVVERI